MVNPHLFAVELRPNTANFECVNSMSIDSTAATNSPRPGCSDKNDHGNSDYNCVNVDASNFSRGSSHHNNLESYSASHAHKRSQLRSDKPLYKLNSNFPIFELFQLYGEQIKEQWRVNLLQAAMIEGAFKSPSNVSQVFEVVKNEMVSPIFIHSC